MTRQKNKLKKNPLTVPAGTEQETGFTRAQTEKKSGPVKIQPIKKEETNIKGRKRKSNL